MAGTDDESPKREVEGSSEHETGGNADGAATEADVGNGDVGDGGSGDDPPTGESGETGSGLLPASIHKRSLFGAVLMGVLVALFVYTEQFVGPVGVLIAVTFPLYFLLGVYRPWRESIPYYDQWLGLPLLAYGAYLVATEWPSVLGVLFAALGAFTLARIVHSYYVSVDVPEPE